MLATNLLTPHKGSEGYARLATGLLLGATVVAIVASIFLSPLKVLGILVGMLTCYVAFWRPDWLLGFLLLYLPFESFLLKFIPDDVYVYGRYYSEVIVYILCAVILWRLATHQIRWRFTYADLPFALFLVALAASSVLNTNPALVSLLGARQIIRFIFLYFVAVQLRLNFDWVKKVMLGLLMVLGIQVVLGYGQVAFGETLDPILLPSERKTVGEIELTQGTDYFWDPGQRVFGTLGRYDRLGVFMAMIMLFLVAYLYEKRQGKYTTYIAGLLCVALPVLAFTYSRSAWFGFLLGALFIAMYIHRDRRVLMGVGIGIVALVVYVLVTGLVVSQLIDLPSQSLVIRFFEAFSLERWYGEYYGLGRLYWMVQTVLTIVPGAVLFGHGPGTYGGGAVAALNYTEVYDAYGLPFGVYGTQGMIDNNWMSLWGETGFIGLILFLWIFLGGILALYRMYRGSHSSELRIFALGLAAAFLAGALNAFLATFLEVRTFAPYLWAFLGVAVGMWEREEDAREAREMRAAS